MAYRSPIVRRMAALCVALLAGAGVVAANTMTAGASDEGTVVLGPGETKTIVSTDVRAPSSLLSFTPAGCQGQAAEICDVYWLNLLIDDHPDAQNFVRATVSWETQRTPNLGAVAAGLNPVLLTDLDMYAYDLSDPEEPAGLSSDEVGGNGIQTPERIGWLADFDKYALVVHNSGPNASLGYKLTISFSNERFTSPFEALDPATQSRARETFERPVDRSGGAGAEPPPAVPDEFLPVGSGSDTFSGQGISNLGGNVVAPDTDFTGFRGGVDNALSGNVAQLASNRVPRVQIGESPPAIIVAFWLLLVPVLLLLAFAYWLRRRRPVALQA